MKVDQNVSIRSSGTKTVEELTESRLSILTVTC